MPGLASATTAPLSRESSTAVWAASSRLDGRHQVRPDDHAVVVLPGRVAGDQGEVRPGRGFESAHVCGAHDLDEVNLVHVGLAVQRLDPDRVAGLEVDVEPRGFAMEGDQH